jgi:outer membrane cobalamin receptor
MRVRLVVLLTLVATCASAQVSEPPDSLRPSDTTKPVVDSSAFWWISGDTARPEPTDSLPSWLFDDTVAVVDTTPPPPEFARGGLPLVPVLGGSAYVPDSSKYILARSFADFVRYEPGFSSVVAGSAPNEVDVNVDGGSARHVFALHNGRLWPVPPAFFHGRGDWRFFSTSGIERVERVRGPLAVLSATGAAWGGVNVVRIAPDTGRAHSRVSLVRGSDGLNRNRVEVTRALSPSLRGTFFVDGYKGDGDRYTDDGSTIALGGNGWWHLRDGVWAEFHIEQSKYKGGVALPIGQSSPTLRERTEWRQAETGFSGRLGRGHWRIGYLIRQTTERLTGYGVDSTRSVRFYEHGYWDARATLPLGAHTLGGWLTRSTDVTKIDSDRFRQDALSGALWDVTHAGRFTFAGGLRGQRVGGEGHSLDAAAGAWVRLSDNLVAYLSGGSSAAFPTLCELRRPTVSDIFGAVVERGNPNLRLERSLATELGVSFARAKTAFDVFVLARDVDDLVVTRDVDPTVFVVREPTHVPEASFREVGARLRTSFLRVLNLNAAYTYLQATDGDGNDLPFCPRHHLVSSFGPRVSLFGGDLILDGWVSAEVWSSAFSNDDPPEEMPSAAILSTGASATLKDATFLIEWHNVTDAEVELVPGEPQARRSVFYGLVWNMPG